MNNPVPQTLIRVLSLSRKWVSALLVPGILLSGTAFADNARDWQNMPVNTPIAFAYYYHMDSNTSLDTSLPIKNASTEINAGLLRFAYAFDAGNGKTSGIQILQTFADVDFSLGGTSFDKNRKGLGDTSVIFATNLFGAPAYTVGEFVRAKPETFLTAAFWVTAPTGRYDSKKMINLGANRWAFKPQLAFGHPFGKNWVEVNAWAQFFTDNDDYLNGRTLKQDPKLGLEGHYSYNVTPWFWISADLFYSHGGKTSVNSLTENEGGDTWKGGIGAQFMFSPKDAVSFAYIDTISRPAGDADVKTFMLSYRRLFF